MKLGGTSMKGLNNFKIKTRIIAILLIMSISSVFIGVLGVVGLSSSNDKLFKVYKKNIEPLEQLKIVSDIYAVNFVNTTYKVINGRMSWIEGEKQIALGKETIKSHWENYKSNELTGVENDLAMQAEKSMKLADTYVDKLLGIMKKQDKENLIKFAANDLDLSMEPIASKLTEIVNIQLGSARTEYEKAKEDYNKIMIALILAITIGLSISIIIGLIIIKSISNQVELIQESIQKDEEGNVTIKKISIRSKDELGLLAASINAVTEQVQNFIISTSESAEKVAAMTQQLTATTEQSSHAVNQVASTVSKVAIGTGEQVEAVSETSGAVEKISSDIQRIMDNTNNMQVAFKEAELATAHGRESVDKVINQMKIVEHSVEGSASIVQKLGERCAEIEQIAGTISDIAAQTNLLALNAAIEAARAGEQGKGFSVVAEEVRKLAVQSQASVVKVTNIIKEITSDTAQAEISMMNGTKEVKTGTEVVNIAEKSFRDISELVADTSSKAKEIIIAIQQMANNSDHIVKAIRGIEEISNTTASQMQAISASTEEQSEFGREIATSSQYLSRMAEDLQKAVNTFKL
jgi:methyl-accepting chemotaxis protein